MTELLFIRHGETDWNRQQRFQGQIDVPLNAHGQQQALRLAQRLAADKYDALFSSDLQRAQQTAAPLADAWGLPVTTLAGFREQHFGMLEGLDVPTIQAQHPALWQHWLQQRGDYALPGGGESLQQFHDRVLAAVQALLARNAGARIAVVTHGGVLDMLWRSAQCLPLNGLRNCEIPNTGLNRLRWQGGALVVEHWGDAEHLAGLAEPAEPAAPPA